MTYAANVASNTLHTTSYKPTSFYTFDKDNTFTYPFEDIPHLLITAYIQALLFKKMKFCLDTFSSEDRLPLAKYCMHAVLTSCSQSAIDSASPYCTTPSVSLSRWSQGKPTSQTCFSQETSGSGSRVNAQTYRPTTNNVRR